jgi:maltokinase
MSVSASNGSTALLPADELVGLLPDYLARQRWYAGDGPPGAVDVVDYEVLRPDLPGLVWALVRVPGDDASYQLLIGLRELSDTEAFLEGKGRGFLGDVDSDDGPLLAYDALVDPELAPAVLAVVAPDEDVTAMRPMVVEQTNTSVVFDDRVILKVFRRVHDEPNPDVEVVEALAAAGYEHTPRPLGAWRRGGRDLAVAREFLPGGADGWHLALVSLRDLYDRRLPPAECGGDFAFEAGRLGQATAELHVALAEAFGTEPGAPGDWLRAIAAGTDSVDPVFTEEVRSRLRLAADPGRQIRIHGDLHLGQVLRTDAGWFMLDFEGEPRIPVADRRRPSSPLRDVAGMLRSFHYASRAALRERHEPADEELQELAQAWEDRNAGAYLGAYLGVGEVDALLSSDEPSLLAVLSAFELAKAVYEVGYERAHRPDWEHIPAEAVERLLR